jgi:hypothetical protein
MRFKRATIWLVFAVACLLALIPTHAQAQALSASDSNAITQPAFDTITDIFIGKGTRGPYVLSWKNIESASETVVLSGRKLILGQDYTIDCGAGVVAFAESLRQDTIARVTYRRIPGKASPGGGGFNLPLSLSLLDRDRANLGLVGFYRAGAEGQASAGVGVLGLTGGAKFGKGSDVSSMFLISQGDATGTGRRPDLWDRSALKLATTTALGNLSFKGSLTRAGEQFAGSKEYGLQQAKGLLDLAATWGKASDLVFASFSYKELEDLGGSQKGATQVASEQRVVLNLPDAPKLTISRAATDKEQPGGAASSVSTDTVQLEQGFGQKTTAAATFQTSKSSSGGSADEGTTTRLTVASSAIDRVQLQGGFTRQDSERAGHATGVDLSAKATPSKRVGVEATFSSLTSETKGEATKTAVKVAASPLDRVNLVADFSRLDTGSGGQSSAGIRVAARPVDQMTVEASYAGKRVVEGAGEEQRAVRVEARPASFVKLSAGLAEKQAGAQQDTTREAGIEIAPSDRLRIATSYRELSNGQTVTTTTDYSGALRPVSFLEVAGAYKDRQSTAANSPDTASLRLALGPSGGLFRVTGQYASNPEDKNGNVQRVGSTILGVEMKLGILGLTGGYTQKDDYAAARASVEKQVGLSAPLFGHGRLSAGCKIAEAMEATAGATTTYSVGYTHIIGSCVNLSLTGELTRHEWEPPIRQDDYRATANVGIRF